MVYLIPIGLIGGKYMKTTNKYIKIITTMLVGVVLVGGAIVYKEGEVGYAKYKFSAKTIYRQKQFKSNEIMFLGDSIVERCNIDALFNHRNIVNEGVSGNTTTDILNRLDSVIRLKPSTLFLHFGVNDLIQIKGQLSNVNINKSSDNYSKIINTIKIKLPNTKIYIESILQVDNNIITERYKTDKLYNFHISHDDIIAFNSKLQVLASKNNITYINHSMH